MIQSVWKNLNGLQKAAEHLWCDFKWATNSSPNTNDLRHCHVTIEKVVCICLCYDAQGAVGGSVPCSRAPRHGIEGGERWIFTPPTDNPCRTEIWTRKLSITSPTL